MPGSAPPTPTAGSTTTARTRSRSTRATISTTTTSRSPSPTRTTGTASATPTTAGAETALQLQPLTSSAHCFKPVSNGVPDVVTQPLRIDAVEPSLSWTMTPAWSCRGAAPSRSSTASSRTPTAACRSAASTRSRRSTSRPSASATPCSRAPPTPSRSGGPPASGWCASTRTAGRCRPSPATWWSTSTSARPCCCRCAGHYHIQSGASFYRNGEGYRVDGPAGQYWTGDRELSPMSNYLVGGRMAFLRRPQQEHATWFAEMEADVKYEILVYAPRLAGRPQRRPPLRPHPARVVRATILGSCNRRERRQAAARRGCDRMRAGGIQTSDR